LLSNELRPPHRIIGSFGAIAIDTNGLNVTFTSPLNESNSGGLTKIGNGRLILTATNTFAGNALVAGGTLALGSPLALQNSTLDTSGSGTLSFGTLTGATLGGLTGPGSLRLSNSSSVAVNLQVGNNGGSTTFSGSLTGSGSLSKVGSGALTLAGPNTYTGPTSINQGSLFVNGSLISAVTVNSGGVLGGTGSMSSVTVNSGGHLAPGDSPATLSLSGSLSLLSGAKMDYELDTPLDSDEVLMPASLLSLNGQQFSDFNFTALGGFGPGSYTLIDAGAISGGLGGNNSGTISGLPATLAIQGNDVVLTVVPEPGSLLLFATASFACASDLYWRRRRYKPKVQAQEEARK
jgi:autotransporter-associated beta strand protein